MNVREKELNPHLCTLLPGEAGLDSDTCISQLREKTRWHQSHGLQNSLCFRIES